MNRLITAGAGLALLATPLVATTATASAAPTPEHAAVRQAPASSVSAAINMSTAIAREDTVKIRGRVSPRAAGDQVVLQQRMENKSRWTVSGKARIKPNGKFLLKDEPTAAGTRYYRVLKPAAGKVKKGMSKELELVVYGWQRLVFRAKGPSSNVYLQNTTISTETFPGSFVTQTPGTPSTIEYTLGKKCRTLRSSYALTDATATGGTGTVALKVDGQVEFTSDLVLGQLIEDRETDLTNAFRISFEMTSTAAPAAFVAVAKPEVLCTK